MTKKLFTFLFLSLIIIFSSSREIKSSNWTIKKPLILAKIICQPEGCFEKERGENSLTIISPAEGEKFFPQKLSLSIDAKIKNYLVELRNAQGIIFNDQVEDNASVSLPQLKPGYYQLTVQTDEALITKSFQILTDQEAQEIKQKVDQNLNPLELAQLYQQNNLITEARKTLEKAIDNNNQSITIYQMLGDLYLEEINASLKARENYQKALAKTPANQNQELQAHIYVSLARIIVNLGFHTPEQYQQAIENLQQAHQLYQNLGQDFPTAQVQQFIGEIYLESNDNQEALKWLQKAQNTYRKIDYPLYESSIIREIQKICTDEDNQLVTCH